MGPRLPIGETDSEGSSSSSEEDMWNDVDLFAGFEQNEEIGINRRRIIGRRFGDEFDDEMRPPWERNRNRDWRNSYRRGNQDVGWEEGRRDI